jgi:hypothetical protein
MRRVKALVCNLTRGKKTWKKAYLIPGPHPPEILELATTSILLGAECGIYYASLLSTFGCALPQK